MNAAVAAIEGYQRWLSPRKGFPCAYRVVHGGTGCSGFGKFAFRRYPMSMAWGLLRLRLEACRIAAADYAEEKRRKAEACLGGACDAVNIGDAIGSCACDAGMCDLGALDIGACA